MRVGVQLLAVLKEQGGNVRCCYIFRPVRIEYSRVHLCCDQDHVTELRSNLSLCLKAPIIRMGTNTA